MPQEPLSADALETLKSLIDPAIVMIDSAIDTMGEPAVIAYFQSLYDAHVVPLDIPYVPEIAEAVIDQIAKQAIARLIRAGHAAIHKPTV
ncbi:MAG: hypothetical protein ACREA9_23270 [Pyrinomonadaceae bacterium]